MEIQEASVYVTIKTLQRIKTTNSSKTKKRLTSEKQHILVLLSKWETRERESSLVNFKTSSSSADQTAANATPEDTQKLGIKQS